jgi:hypothetical protein
MNRSTPDGFTSHVEEQTAIVLGSERVLRECDEALRLLDLLAELEREDPLPAPEAADAA